MSAIGIDLGSSKATIAVARNKGIDIVVNEVSNRFTPAMVSFLSDRRLLGESAKTQEITNYKNSITNFKLFVGRDFKEADVQEEAKKVFYTMAECEDGSVGAKVSYKDQSTFSMLEIFAMYLTQLKQISEVSLGSHIAEAVISVPAYYTDRQRHALLNAAEIAGINCIRLLNESTAGVLALGITRASEFPENDPKNFVFVDIGYTAMTITIAAFTKDKAVIKASHVDKTVGGRVFDEILANYYAQKIKEKYKEDVTTKPRAYLRLLLACEKLKKMLSANSQAPLNIESLTDEIDVSLVANREEFEGLIAHIMEKIPAAILVALHSAGVSKDQIEHVEIIGGSTRIPLIQKTLESVFEGKSNVVSKTLNMDEAVARGCALQCAMLSPMFRVREYTIKDTTAYPIKVSWKNPKEDTFKEQILFKANDQVPISKVLTLNRSEPFEIFADYADPSTLPTGSKTRIGHFLIKNVKPNKNGELSEVKLKVSLNKHGIFTVESAQLLEEEEVEVTKMEVDGGKKEGEGEAKTPGTDAPMEEDKPAAAAATTGSTEQGAEGKKTVKVRKIDLPVESFTSTLSPSVINTKREAELSMIAGDKLIADTLEKKNQLEEFIYEMRGKFESSHQEFMNEKVREEFMKKLSENEEWLYGEGEDCQKGVYVERLEQLKKISNPAIARYIEHEERTPALNELRNTISQLKSHATSNDPKYEHIEEAEKKKVIDACEAKEAWLKQTEEGFSKLPKDQDPKVLTSQIKAAREELNKLCVPILTKPKPKPKEEPPKADAPKAETKPEEAKAPEGDKKETKPQEPKKEADPMDVD